VNIILKSRYMLIIKYICDWYDKIFCHKKFSRYMFICRNAEGVHCQRKVQNPWSRC